MTKLYKLNLNATSKSEITFEQPLHCICISQTFYMVLP